MGFRQGHRGEWSDVLPHTYILLFLGIKVTICEIRAQTPAQAAAMARQPQPRRCSLRLLGYPNDRTNNANKTRQKGMRRVCKQHTEDLGSCSPSIYVHRC